MRNLSFHQVTAIETTVRLEIAVPLFIDKGQGKGLQVYDTSLSTNNQLWNMNYQRCEREYAKGREYFALQRRSTNK